MSVFGLLMMTAMSGPSLADLAFVAPAWADQKADMEAASLAKAEAEKLQKEATQAKKDADQASQEAADAAAKAEALGTEEAASIAKEAKEKADKAEGLAKEAAEKSKDAAKSSDDAMRLALTLHCPNGIATCYKADGTEFTDVNNLPASAAGPSFGGSDGGSSVVKPVHFRTF